MNFQKKGFSNNIISYQLLTKKPIVSKLELKKILDQDLQN